MNATASGHNTLSRTLGKTQPPGAAGPVPVQRRRGAARETPVGGTQVARSHARYGRDASSATGTPPHEATDDDTLDG